MSDTPFLDIAEWDGPQGSPWLIVNKAMRQLEGFSLRTSVKDRDLTAPAPSCADGDRYLVATGGSGLWAGADGQVAIALGANAINGWAFVEVEHVDTQIWVEDENRSIRWLSSGVWQAGTTVFVDLTGAPDGGTLRYDLSNGNFYVA